MSDEYLAEWRPYKVTAEQLPKLQRKEKEAIDAFYLENYDYFIGCAKNQFNRYPDIKSMCTYEDILQDIYANLFHNGILFENVKLFNLTLNRSMPYSAFGGFWNRKHLQSSTFGGWKYCPFTLVITNLDDPIGSDDADLTFKDRIVDPTDPYIVLAKEQERRRQDIIEIKSEELLRSFLSPTLFRRWQEGKNYEEINRELRKHADEILVLLRRYGTREDKFLHNVLVSSEVYSEYLKKKVTKAEHLAWEREHLDELSTERRRVVVQGMRMKERRKAGKEAKEAQLLWEEEHLDLLSPVRRKCALSRIYYRKRMEKARASV